MPIAYPIHDDHPNGDEKPIPAGTMIPVTPPRATNVPVDLIPEPPKYFGNFHKTLPHDGVGQVDHVAYEQFSHICTSLPAAYEDFELVASSRSALLQPPNDESAHLVNPQAGRSITDGLCPDPGQIKVPPPPSVMSDSTAAEMVELFWMAQLRDVPFDQLANPHLIGTAVHDVHTAFAKALASSTTTPGDRLELGTDLPADAKKLDLTYKTLFRIGLKDEVHGPLVSQFMLHDINYGAQLIQQTQVPYRAGRNYLTDFDSWLLAQNTGRDKDGDPYAQDNDFEKDMTHFDPPLANGDLPRYRIRNMRDLARFVNRDALHQAYFNAALLLNNWGAPLGPGNPYRMGGYKRQDAFGTLGGPNLLSLVSEVAARALRVAWRQKWIVHRRLRPEAYGGLMQVQKDGVMFAGATPEAPQVTVTRAYGLPDWLFNRTAVTQSRAVNGTYLLPLAYSAGSPAHPSYVAGHAAVAGACVTILKAWFKEDVSILSLMAKARKIDQPQALGIWQPGDHAPGGPLPAYGGSDAGSMTVIGELNKLAANVAMGRCMGGVHFRTDNTRSLRLGEQVATIILKRLAPTYAEWRSSSMFFTYTSFDGEAVTIAPSTITGPHPSAATVTVAGNPALSAFYNGL